MPANLRSGNLLLARLPDAELAALAADAEIVTLERPRMLVEPNQPIRDVWFPINCLASLVTLLADGSSVESGAVGRHGMVGIPVILDAEMTSMQTLIQVPGDAVRVGAARVKEVFDGGGVLKQILNRYVHMLFVVASQSAACNRRHQIDARLARWLLVSADGIGSEEIAITHEFLAVMLGVRRSSVTETALKLQERGLIDYRRANVTILDRPGTEAASCECYAAQKREIERVLG